MTTTEVERLKRREHGAWTEVFEREHPLVYRFVLVQVRNQAVAEDITGQVFVEAISGIRRYRDRGKPLNAWLLTIARHRTIDWYRRQNREQGIVVEPLAQAPEVGADGALTALALLKPEQREVVHLRFVEGYSIEEVATLMDRSAGAVKALQHRAIARLRTILTPANTQGA